MSGIKAVIFDMDGVLIDSEPVYMEYQYNNLRKRYPWIKIEDLYPMAGMSGKEAPGFLAKVCRCEVEDPDFQKELEHMYDGERIDYSKIMRPQVPGLLEYLRNQGLQVALASSSPLWNIKQVLEDCQIEDYFCEFVSGDQFTNSKPDPEIYNVLMEMIGRKPEECLVIEDSTYGVTAAVRAGTIVAALEDTRFSYDQSSAQFHIESLDEIEGLVAKLTG